MGIQVNMYTNTVNMEGVQWNCADVQMNMDDAVTELCTGTRHSVQITD